MYTSGWCIFIIFKIIITVFEVNSQSYKEEYYDQIIDHFNFLSNGNKTFPHRYLYNDSWWDPEKGPIFFYCGNEASVETYWNATGFMLDIAPQFNALLLFAEHRYFGKSLPFGEISFSRDHIGYMSVEQVVVDYAFLINYVKERFKAHHSPVIAFGGSYGGTLAAYMRFKFPNLVHGAIAASAGIFAFADIQPSTFFQSVTKIFDNYDGCQSSTRAAFSQLDEYSKFGKLGFQKISRSFNLCEDLNSYEDYKQLLYTARYAFTAVSMANYPYATDFLGNLPAFPVKVMCNRLTSNPTMKGLYSAISLLYNSTDDFKCLDIYKAFINCADPTGCGSGNDVKAWDYAACTEVFLSEGTNNITDMFPNLPFNASIREDYCWKKYQVIPRRNVLKTMMWGKDIESSSNIVFSNGDLDPWFDTGIHKNLSESLVAVIIKGAAHHLDLRGHNSNDPPSVISARKFEIENIRKWLKFAYSKIIA